MKKLLLLTFFVVVAMSPTFAWTTDTYFYAQKSGTSPSGSGRIYIYHAKHNNDVSPNEGRPDVLRNMSDDMWLNADQQQSSGKITMGNGNSDYKGDGYVSYNSNNEDATQVALNMYFYAKPNPGYRFLGWKGTDDKTMSDFATGSDLIYTTDKSKAGQTTKWNNGRAANEEPITPPAGYYADQDYYYLRYVRTISKNANQSQYFYAYFELIPQQFSFGGTGESDITYNASSDGVFNYTIGENGRDGLSSATSKDITLTMGSYDTDMFRFDGWRYDYVDTKATSHTGVLLSTSPTATYTLNSDAASRSNVRIYPDISSMSDKTAIVEFDGDKTFWDNFPDALADAIDKSSNRGDKPAPVIKMLNNATGLNLQTITQTLTINLNGTTISGTGSSGSLFNIEGEGVSVTISDNKSTGKIEMTDNATQYTYAMRIKSGASLTLTGGTISNSNTKDNGSARGIEVQTGGELFISGGAVEVSSLQEAYAVINRASTAITNGSLTAIATNASTAIGLLNTTNSTAETAIDGGVFYANAVTGSAYGIQCATGTITATGGRFEALSAKAYGAYQSGGTLMVEGGYFPSSTTAAVGGDVRVKGGRYVQNTNIDPMLVDGFNIYELKVGADYTLGYRYEVTPTQTNPHTFKIIEMSGTSYYETLQDALAYAANVPSSLDIIQIVPEYTLPAGNYTLPSYASLVIPQHIDQQGPSMSLKREDTYLKPYLYKKLIISEGVRFDVYGTIEAGGTQNTLGQGSAGAGVPRGAYGQIVMEEGSRMILNYGSRLNAWGFITGKGEIDARRGANVFEQFQMYDWKGGWGSSKMLGNSKKVFPVTQYSIQNIEAPVIYHPGSSLIGATSINVSSTPIASDVVKVIGVYGDIAMFLMDDEDDSDDTWVRKEYDIDNDRQVYKVNSSARLGSMQLTMEGLPVIGTLDFNSQNYVLPITNNMKIELLFGNMEITQNTVLLPGAEIEIDKEATVSILDNTNVSYDGTLYLMDADQWEQGHVYSNAFAQQVRYSPTFNGAPNKRGHMEGTTFVMDKPGDATLFVHGTFDVQGTIQTTEGGANIYSTKEDAGTIIFSKKAPTTSGSVSVFKNMTGSTASTEVTYQDYSTASALLLNEIGSAYGQFSPTAGIDAGESFCFIDMDGDGKGEWMSLTVDDECFVYDNNGVYYAKPADYVALANGKTENPDHTYSSADGTRTFILVIGCQWWEVVYDVESGLYYCDKNDTYYYYDDSDPDPQEHGWKVKTYTVTWQNWDGTTIVEYDNAHYGAMPEYLGSTPKRTKDDYYTYDFVGWAPALSPVTEDATYIAQYERKDRMYTITWKDELGNTIENDYCKMGQIPECYNAPDMTSKEWSPAVSAVTGDQIYTLTAKNNDGPFDIKFMNWNGLQIGETQSVAKNVVPVAPANPSKTALTDIEFVFAGWRAANNTVYASNAIPAATENAVYTATFTEQPITYTILWKNYNDALLETDENVTPNTVPQYNGATPTKPSDETYNYAFSGWAPEVVAATEDAIYTAQFSATPKDKIIDTDETIDGGTQQTVTNLTIEKTGKLVIPTTSRVNATNLYLEATSDASGQLITNANTSINITGSAYFDWTMNGTTGSVRRTWYAVAVPWEVDARTGITEKATGRTLTAGRDFDLIYYNGAKRASEGNVASCWEYVQWDIQGHDRQGNPRPVDNLLHPGRLYMMYFAAEGLQTVRFEKAAGADVMYMGSLNVNAYPESTNNDDKDGGWNGIANPRTYFASLSAGSATYAQVLNNGNLDDYFAGESSPVYQTINLVSSSFMVGKPVFLQATGSDPVVVTKQTTAGIVNAAPRRNRETATLEGIDAVYQLTIAAEGKPSSDNLFVQVAEDEKADKYVIGKDLSKGGVAAKRAQMWVDRYNTKLSVNTQMLVNDEATYPLVLFAPTAGDYTISNIQSTMSNEDYDLYLTLNGQAIWNLANGDYTMSLPQGNTTDYGLRISARKSPTVATGIDEAVVDAKGETQKVLINNQVFIIRGEKVYTIDGQLVK